MTRIKCRRRFQFAWWCGLAAVLAIISSGTANAAALCVNTTRVGSQIRAIDEKHNWENLEDICAAPTIKYSGTTLAANPALAVGQCTQATTGFLCEGATADASEALLTFPTLTADRTYTFPDQSGTVAMTSDITVGLDPNGTSGGLTLNGGLLSADHLSLFADAANTTGPFIRLIGTGNTTLGSDPPNSGGQILVKGGAAGLFMSSADGGDGLSVDDNSATLYGETNNVNITSAGVVINYSSGFHSLTVDNRGTVLDTALTLTPIANPPATCNGSAEGRIYSDTSHALCFCDGSTWQKVVGAGTCA